MNDKFDKIAESKQSSKFTSIDVDHREAQIYIPSNQKKRQIINDTTYAFILRNEILMQIKKLIQQNKKCKVIELGCGSGWLSLEMARFGAEVIGYDTSIKMIQIANKMKKENKIKKNFGSLKYINQDMEKFEAKKDSIDLIISWESLYFAKNPNLIMKKIKEALKINKYLIIVQSTKQRAFEKYISYLFELFLPTYNRSYKEKFILVYSSLTKKSLKRQIKYYISNKDFYYRYSKIVENIKKDYQIISYKKDLAFCSIPMIRLNFKNKILRYYTQYFLKKIDDFLCFFKFVNGTRNYYCLKKK